MNTATKNYMAGVRGQGFRARKQIGQAYESGYADGVESTAEEEMNRANAKQMAKISLEEEVKEFVTNLIGDRGVNFQITASKLMQKARAGFYFAKLMDWPADDAKPVIEKGKLFSMLLRQAIEGHSFTVNRRRWSVRSLSSSASRSLWFELN
jgi:hypothetical protein